jgi:hypothetical protein
MFRMPPQKAAATRFAAVRRSLRHRCGRNFFGGKFGTAYQTARVIIGAADARVINPVVNLSSRHGTGLVSQILH